MILPTEIAALLLGSILGVQGWILLTMLDLKERIVRIETALKLHGLLGDGE